MSFGVDKNEYTIFCSRCGNEYSSNSRYCMKCGNLNPDHPSNKKLAKFINNHKEEYSVGGGERQVQVNQNEVRGKGIAVSLGTNTGNFNTCFVINLLLYLAFVLITGLIFYYFGDFDWRNLVSSPVGIIWIFFTILCILIYSCELVYMKMNKPWWSSLIPFYNNIVLADSLYNKPFIGFLTIIPGIGFIVQFVLWYKLGKSFKKSGLFTALLPFLMFPLIGFDSSSFNGNCYVSGSNTLEKEYKKKHALLTVFVLFLFCGGGMFGYANYNKIQEAGEKSSRLYLVISSKIIENQLNKKIESGNYTCKNSSSDVMYFYFPDISDPFFIIYGSFVEVTSATVKVEKGEDGYKYYIAMTNGKYGFPETLSSEITGDSVVEFKDLDLSYRSKCRVRN